MLNNILLVFIDITFTRLKDKKIITRKVCHSLITSISNIIVN